MRDFAGACRAGLLRQEGEHGDRLAVQSRKFHFVARFVAMDEHDGADATNALAVLGHIARQDDVVEFVDHSVLFSRMG